ncbi:hypothetical protein MaudCBS49596_001284 [Microsporum audouinii]
MLTKLVATSLLALQGAAAFLIVPGVNSPHSIETADARKFSIATTCSKCPFPEDSDTAATWKSDVDSYMLFDLATDAGKLYVNKKEIYPSPDESVNLQTSLVRKSDEHLSRQVATGYILEILRAPEAPTEEDGPELLTFYFTPVQLDGLPAAADTLYIPVIKTTKGNLVIVNSRVEATAAPQISWKQCGRDAQCWKRLLVARIVATLHAAKVRAAQFAEKVSSSWRGCHGKPQGNSMEHGHGHHRYQNPTFSRSFARALRFVIIPAIIGLCLSLVVCSIGSLVGHCLVALWRYSRSQRNAHRRTLDSAQEDGEASEKEGLMTREDADLAPQEEDQLHGHIKLPADKA